MAKPPRRPRIQTRRTDAASEKAASRVVVAKPVDPRQAGLFDAPLLAWIKPCLPTLVEKPTIGPEWVYEITSDGYRVAVYVADDKATIRTRNGHDWTALFPTIAAAATRLKVRSAVVDGAAVVLDDQG